MRITSSKQYRRTYIVIFCNILNQFHLLQDLSQKRYFSKRCSRKITINTCKGSIVFLYNSELFGCFQDFFYWVVLGYCCLRQTERMSHYSIQIIISIYICNHLIKGQFSRRHNWLAGVHIRIFWKHNHINSLFGRSLHSRNKNSLCMIWFMILKKLIWHRRMLEDMFSHNHCIQFMVKKRVPYLFGLSSNSYALW